MRVTNNMLINSMLYNTGKNLELMSQRQDQLATGKKFQVPSEDPVGASRVLKYKKDLSELDQHESNTRDALGWMETTETSIRDINSYLQRARELAVQAANATNSQDETRKIKYEMEQIKIGIIANANMAYAGRYVFSHFQTDKPLLKADGSYNIDLTGYDAANPPKIMYEIGAAEQVVINTDGMVLLNGGVTPTAGDTRPVLLGDLEQFITALDSDDKAGIQAFLGQVDGHINNTLTQWTSIGARTNHLELVTNRIAENKVTTEKMLSDAYYVDMSEVIMHLKNAENVYKASLSAGSRVIQPTLVDFLR